MKWVAGIMVVLLMTTVSPLANYRCQNLDRTSFRAEDELDPCDDGITITDAPAPRGMTLSVLVTGTSEGNAGISPPRNFIVAPLITPKQVVLPLTTPPPKAA
ncbi:MAG: hypothetical protein KAG20_00915 [Cocleimonas sp.]|nr:hypothetical protein [Cocleimonas sp.]